jgi:phage terminase small subunit
MAIPALTARQELFAQHFATTRSVVQAYRAAYDCEGVSPKAIDKRGREVLQAPQVDKRIRELLDLGSGGSVETLAKVHQVLWDIINADPNELVSLKLGCCRYCHGEGHQKQWKEHEYFAEIDRVDRFNAARGNKQAEELYPDIGGGFGFDESAPPVDDCPACNGQGEPRIVLKDTEHLSPGARALYGGVQQTNTGLKVILADKLKALEMLARIHGGFNDNLKLSGSLTAITKSVALNTTDPNEAERIYRDFIAGKMQVDGPVTVN